MIKYCKKCVMPDTKPDLSFDEEGICSACRSYENRKTVDWAQRKIELMTIVEKYKNKNNTNWDCIVPVSGGKDSTYQVVRMLELGMNPLCVTATTCDLSELGRKNIENLKGLGVDYIEVTTNRATRKKLNKIGLERVGDISWPEHASIFTIPLRIAVSYKIPLIVWGENSQNEYGGPAADAQNNVLTRKWLKNFGGMLGLEVQDMIEKEGVDARHMIPFTYPTDEELAEVGVTGIFLGHYIPWDGFQNSIISQGYGMTSYHKAVEGSIASYENLDNYQTGIHDYFKYLKYGFCRTSDMVSLHIRRGRLTREDGMNLVKLHDGRYPNEYLGKKLEDILAPLDMTVEEFDAVCDRYTNKALFECDETGQLLRDRHKNLIKINYDNA